MGLCKPTLNNAFVEMLIKNVHFAGRSVGISLGIYRRYKCNVPRRKTNDRAIKTTYDMNVTFGFSELR
jgi:hypothetical protein